MPRSSTPVSPSALGFQPKSGWAVCVLLGGSVAEPAVLDRCQVELSDPADPHTRQPYHAATGEAQLDPEVIARLRAVVTRCAGEAIPALLHRCQGLGHQPTTAGVVAGSLADPVQIGNLHMRAHAYEGQLFRVVLEQALGAQGLRVVVVRGRDLLPGAAAVLGQPEPVLRSRVTELGRSVGSPWRSEQKAATLAAWLALAGAAPSRQGA